MAVAHVGETWVVQMRPSAADEARKDLHPEACPRLPILKHLERVVVASAVIGNPHG
jgi:hypothetical protein